MTQPDWRAGGEFEFSVEEHSGEAAGGRDILAAPNELLTDTGRSALLIAAKEILAAARGRKVWLPAFSCRSVSQPFEQAGFEIAYYPVGANLVTVDPKRIAAESGDTLLFIHYFGHVNRPMIEFARECRKKGIVVIEDRVQAGLVTGLEEQFDFSVKSYRKLLPVVDGAVLSRGESTDVSNLRLSPPDEEFISSRFAGKVMRGASIVAQDFLPLFEHSEGLLEGEIVPRKMSWLSRWLWRSIDLSRAGERRRSNWKVLCSRLDEIPRGCVRPLFPELGDSEVPLGMPVVAPRGKRDSLRKFLSHRNIFCPVHWNLDHLPESEDFSDEREVSSRMLTLPVDQRLDGAGMNRVADAVAEFVRAELEL